MQRICVFCGSSPGRHADYREAAVTFGRALARAGIGLVYGGASIGLMGAVADAARAGGGHTIGVIPQSLVDLEVADTAADELVITEGMAARKTVMIDRSDAFLVLPGGLGTLDELFEVWTLSVLGLHDKPILLLDADGFYAGLMGWLESVSRERFIGESAMSLLRVVSTVDCALDDIERVD